MRKNIPEEKSVSTTFIGLGAMGYPMAGHLQTAGYPTTVYNRSCAKASHWHKTHQGNTAPTPADAALNADIAFVCVGNDDDVREVTLGAQGVLTTLRPGSILVDHTTASADLARELQAACKEKQVGFLDAPVSGGQAGAESGQLTIMVGGELSTFQSAQPVMSVYGKSVRLWGPVVLASSPKWPTKFVLPVFSRAYLKRCIFPIARGSTPPMWSRLLVRAPPKAGKWITVPKP